MIRILDANPAGASRFDGVGRTVGLDLAVASGTAILAFLYFAVGFAAGDSPQPILPSVIVFLLTIATGIAVLGFWGGWRWSRFPWLAVTLTPLLLAAFFSLIGDSGAGLNIGVMASAVLLIGALIGRALRHFGLPLSGGREMLGPSHRFHCIVNIEDARRLE